MTDAPAYAMLDAMSNAIRLVDPMTVEEFQTWQPEPEQAGWRWQLIEGPPVGMAPTSIDHGAIQSRCSTSIDMHLQKLGRCVVVTAPGVISKDRSRAARCGQDAGNSSWPMGGVPT